MTNLFKELWSDESGLLVTAEAVVVGTVGVLGATIGLRTISNAVNDELNNLSNAYRGLNQDYFVSGFTSDFSRISDSSFQQESH